MSLQQALNEGDWVRAESKYGVVIEGQVTHDKALVGTANLIIMIDPTAALEEDRQMRAAAKEAWRRAGLDE